MPLSEDEQRILRDIEANFYENDPKFVRSVSKVSQKLGHLRGLRLPLTGFVAGLTLVVSTYKSLWFVAIIGFAVMVVSAGFFTQVISQRAQIAQAKRDESSGDSDEPGSQDFKNWPNG